MSGTYMATPHVAGAIALYLSAHPGASYPAVYEALVRNVDTANLKPEQQNCGGVSDAKYPNNSYGHGRLNVFKTLSWVPTTKPVFAPGSCVNAYANLWFMGFDLTNTSQANPNNCCADCEATPGCKLFVWVPDHGGMCLLKSEKGFLMPLQNTYYAEVKPTTAPTFLPTPAPTSSPATTLTPSPTAITPSPFPTPATTAESTPAPTSTPVSTVAPTPDPTTVTPTPSPTPDATVAPTTSPTSAPTPSPTPTTTVTPTPSTTHAVSSCVAAEDNADFAGFDLSSTSQSNSDSCCADCEATAGCKLYVWTNHQGGTCWLKHTKGPKGFLAGAKSAEVKRTLAPTPAPTQTSTAAPTSCVVPEVNADFAGFDLTPTHRSNSDLCCGDCEATPGCKLYVWTSHEGGTCWLKREKGPKSFLAGAKSAEVKRTVPTTPAPTPSPTTSAPPTCVRAEANVDFAGFDIASTARSNSDDCCADCEKTTGCKLYVWSNHNGGTCWLKSKKGAKSFQAGTKSAEVNNAPTCTKVEDNVDYFGNDLTSTSQASADNCCADCDATPGCKLFVWVATNGGTCWLKHTIGAKKTAFGAKAAVVIKKCTQEPNVDYSGGDVADTQRASADSCCEDCQTAPGCKFYTWTAYNGGTCWLKSSRGQATKNSNSVSGAI